MTVCFAVEDLTVFCTRIFETVGVPHRVSDTVARSLVYADMRGIESHGVIRTPIYVRRVAEKMVDPEAEIRVEEDGGVSLLIDGANNFGAYVGSCAMQLGVQRAKAEGLCVIGVKHSNHYGIGAFYASRAVEHGMAFVGVSNASQTMPPSGGIRPFLGTNPLTVAFPTNSGAPFLLDMATSLVARGKIIAAAKRGDTQIPEGWALDDQGRATRDPQRALDGAVLPMGGPKGFGLAMSIDILAGVLTGAGYGPEVKNMYNNWREPQNVGHFFILFDISRFMPLAKFCDRLNDYIRLLKNEPVSAEAQGIFYAGEIEQAREAKSRELGVSLPSEVANDLFNLAQRHGVTPPPALN